MVPRVGAHRHRAHVEFNSFFKQFHDQIRTLVKVTLRIPTFCHRSEASFLDLRRVRHRDGHEQVCISCTFTCASRSFPCVSATRHTHLSQRFSSATLTFLVNVGCIVLEVPHNFLSFANTVHHFLKCGHLCPHLIRFETQRVLASPGCLFVEHTQRRVQAARVMCILPKLPDRCFTSFLCPRQARTPTVQETAGSLENINHTSLETVQEAHHVAFPRLLFVDVSFPVFLFVDLLLATAVPSLVVPVVPPILGQSVNRLFDPTCPACPALPCSLRAPFSEPWTCFSTRPLCSRRNHSTDRRADPNPEVRPARGETASGPVRRCGNTSSMDPSSSFPFESWKPGGLIVGGFVNLSTNFWNMKRLKKHNTEPSNNTSAGSSPCLELHHNHHSDEYNRFPIGQNCHPLPGPLSQ